tara:strand:+ start:453 stop:833 length:381 start_codon:yes stop_codon:yes gene_type:complete
MILLQQSQLNEVALTLTELANLSNPINWLFVFDLEQSQGDEEYSKRVQLLDVGTSANRFNYFEIIEGTDVTFDKVGMYKYRVYQMPNDTSTNETEGVLVETGKMKLVGTDDPQYNHTVTTETYING